MIPKGPLECPLCFETFIVRKDKPLIDGGLVLTSDFEGISGEEINIGDMCRCGSCGVQFPIGMVLMHNDVEDL